MATKPTINQIAKDSRLYIWVAILVPITVLLGFARTYYLKVVFGSPALPPLLHLHGIVMTAWITLFVTQIGLVSGRRTKLHQRLGILGAMLATLVIAVGSHSQ